MSGTLVSGLDMESLKLITDSVARTAANEVADQLEKKMTEQHTKLKNEITDEFRRDLKGYFGKLEADEHIIQHRRIDKLLNFLDKTGENLVGRVITQLFLWGAVLLVIGYAAFGKTPS